MKAVLIVSTGPEPKDTSWTRKVDWATQVRFLRDTDRTWDTSKFLLYLSKNYEALPHIMAFMHEGCCDWHSPPGKRFGQIPFDPSTIHSLGYVPISTRLGNRCKFDSSLPACTLPDRRTNEKLSEFTLERPFCAYLHSWLSTIQTEQGSFALPLETRTYCCNEFFTTRRAVRKYSRSTWYDLYLKSVNTTRYEGDTNQPGDLKERGFAIEQMWPYLLSYNYSVSGEYTPMC